MCLFSPSLLSLVFPSDSSNEVQSGSFSRLFSCGFYGSSTVRLWHGGFGVFFDPVISFLVPLSLGITHDAAGGFFFSPRSKGRWDQIGLRVSGTNFGKSTLFCFW